MERIRKILRGLVAITLSLSICAVITLLIITSPEIKTPLFPDFNTMVFNNLINSIEIVDENNNTIKKVNSNGQSVIQANDLQKHTINAFLAIEDKKFYTHNGFDPTRIASSIIKNLLAMKLKEGASTITQQTIKNVFLSSEKTFSRKITEIRLAREAEKIFTKEEILSAYLNSIYFGNDAYGIENASNRYFNKSATKLNIGESALLAGIINNPSIYNPLKNNEKAEKRKRLVLEEMRKSGFITKFEEEYYSNPTPLQYTSINDGLIISYSCKFAKTDKINYYNSKIQNIVENVLKAHSSDDYTTAITVIDVKKGLPISGASDSFAYSYKTKRSPGSTIKPFICYAPALQKKIISPATPLLDEQTSFDNYSPKNYNNKYYGWTTAKNCLAKSLNIPAVKLLNTVGIEYAKSVCSKFGFEFSKNDNGLALALGGMEYGANLITISMAYSILAKGGHNIISKENAYLLNYMLNETVRSGTAVNLQNKNVYAKTGTVGNKDGNTDAYCIAYNDKYVVGVWCGALDGYLPENITGGSKPTIIADEILKRPDLCGGALKKPNTVSFVDIDSYTLDKKHVVSLAKSTTPPKDRMSEPFSIYNMPESKTEEDLFFGDYENFKIVDSFFD